MHMTTFEMLRTLEKQERRKTNITDQDTSNGAANPAMKTAQ